MLIITLSSVAATAVTTSILSLGHFSSGVWEFMMFYFSSRMTSLWLACLYWVTRSAHLGNRTAFTKNTSSSCSSSPMFISSGLKASIPSKGNTFSFLNFFFFNHHQNLFKHLNVLISFIFSVGNWHCIGLWDWTDVNFI